MKTEPTQPISAALELLETELNRFIALEAEIPKKENLFAASRDRLAQLERTGDLESAKLVAEISSLQALGQLEPRRMEHLRNEITTCKDRLFDACCMTAKNVFRPRCTELRERIATKVSNEIGGQFKDADALERAVAVSSAMQCFDGINGRVVIGGNDTYRVAETARRLLDVWKQLDIFEQEYLS